VFYIFQLSFHKCFTSLSSLNPRFSEPYLNTGNRYYYLDDKFPLYNHNQYRFLIYTKVENVNLLCEKSSYVFHANCLKQEYYTLPNQFVQLYTVQER